MPNRRLVIAAGAIPLMVFLGVYTLRAGHGFLLDDYGWVVDSRVRSLADAGRLFAATGGFFRPVVGMTFTVNEWTFGAHPLGYGLTNVAIAIGCAAAVVLLGRRLTLTMGASIVAGLLWLLNFHFTKMGIMWISGRTALVVTLGAVLTAVNLVGGRLAWALVWLAVALLAKEEAVLLPVVLAAWLLVIKRDTGRPPVAIGSWILGSGVVLGAYLVARASAGAMTPATAPSYYQLQFLPSVVWANVVEYADRTCTLAVAAVLVGIAILGWRGKPTSGVGFQSRTFGNRLPRSVSLAAIWLVGTLGFAYVLPVRSDLYAAVPGVGACLIAAAILERVWQASTLVRRRHALVAAMVLPLALSPVYWARAGRQARFAEFSQAILTDLERLTRALPPGARVVIDDIDAESGARPATMAATFGAQLGDAYQMRTGYRLDLSLTSDAPPDGRAAPPAQMRLAVRDGRLQVVEGGK